MISSIKFLKDIKPEHIRAVIYAIDSLNGVEEHNNAWARQKIPV